MNTEMIEALEIGFVSFWIHLPRMPQSRLLLRRHLYLNLAGDGPRHLTLHRQYIFQIAVITAPPQPPPFRWPRSPAACPPVAASPLPARLWARSADADPPATLSPPGIAVRGLFPGTSGLSVPAPARAADSARAAAPARDSRWHQSAAKPPSRETAAGRWSARKVPRPAKKCRCAHPPPHRATAPETCTAASRKLPASRSTSEPPVLLPPPAAAAWPGQSPAPW